MLHHLPMFAFFLLSFLLLAVVLAIAVFLAFKSGAEGQTKLGGCAGCAIGFALLVIAGMGGLAILFVAAGHASDEALRHGPIKKLHLDFPDNDSTRPTPPTPPGGAPPAENGSRSEQPHSNSFKLVLELRGTDDASKVVEKVRDATDANHIIRVQERVDANGQKFTAIEIEFALDDEDRSDLRELEEGLKEAIPGLELPRGATVEFKTVDD